MENTAVESSELSTIPPANVDDPSANIPDYSNDEVKEPKYDFSPEQITSIMEIIASTGKYWHDWEMLKSLLSIRLKQVLAEYPEAQMVSGVDSQKSSLSGETYSELVKRLDEALLSFTDGPPFTLQRLCEILLDPKGTYKILSKLALALEKNLLVTSTLTMCTDPYPGELRNNEDLPGMGVVMPHVRSIPKPNGVESVASDVDEEMAEAETMEDATNNDTEMQEEKVPETSGGTTDPCSDVNPSIETCGADGEQNPSNALSVMSRMC